MAESYTVSEDGTVYTFTLREGLKWSDGSPLTAKDFEYSWKRVLNPELASETAYTLYGVIKNGYEAFVEQSCSVDEVGVKALDDLTLEVTLTRPRALFPFHDRLHRLHAGAAGHHRGQRRGLGNRSFHLCVQRPVHGAGNAGG